MLTRPIRILLFTLLTAGLAMPSAWVLCLEPSGEVRVELAGCCATTADATPAPAVQQEDAGCHGCEDFSVFAPGLRAARADCQAAVLPPAECIAIEPLADRGSFVRDSRRGRERPRASFLAHLASTVITC